MIEPSAAATPSPALSQAVASAKGAAKSEFDEDFATHLAASGTPIAIPDAATAAVPGLGATATPAVRQGSGNTAGKFLPLSKPAGDVDARRPRGGGGTSTPTTEESEGERDMEGAPADPAAPTIEALPIAAFLASVSVPPRVDPDAKSVPMSPFLLSKSAPERRDAAAAPGQPAAQQGSAPEIAPVAFAVPHRPAEAWPPIATAEGANLPDGPASPRPAPPVLGTPILQVPFAVGAAIPAPEVIRLTVPSRTEGAQPSVPVATGPIGGSVVALAARSSAPQGDSAADTTDCHPSRPPPGGELSVSGRASEPARAAAAPAVAGDLLPPMTPRDGAPLLPPVTMPAPASSAPAPQDFATLVDRLVAAREAAQPSVVHATLAHVEFGRIQLRLAPDGDGLSVALASADPGFAAAAQAAAASQATASRDDRDTPNDRDDRAPPHSFAGASDDRGGQPQSRGSTPDLPASRRQPPARAFSTDGSQRARPSLDETPERSGGIYA